MKLLEEKAPYDYLREDNSLTLRGTWKETESPVELEVDKSHRGGPLELQIGTDTEIEEGK